MKEGKRMNNQQPIFLEPVFQERLWGGQKLTHFGYELPYEHTGECWGISAHSNGLSTVKTGPYAGHTLADLWKTETHLFGGETTGEFPLLVKLLDAKQDLSVQVHPNDSQAARLEDNEAYGKTECWYVVEAEEGAELILGHTATSKAEFEQKIKKGEWDELLSRTLIQAGDFFHVPSGTIHAIGAGSVILETQQSSDTTYRVYDFNRTDDKGNKRELHLDKAKEVSMIPHQPYPSQPTVIESSVMHKVLKLVSTEFFTVYKAEVVNKWTASFKAPYLLISILTGSGELHVNGITSILNKGDHLVLPCGTTDFDVTGKVEMIISHT